MIDALAARELMYIFSVRVARCIRSVARCRTATFSSNYLVVPKPVTATALSDGLEPDAELLA
jgi:hypothetical protein